MNTVRKVVLTGGPCAGKTTLTQVIARVFQKHVVIIPEAASLLFTGGFPRWPELEASHATQRAIYHVQCELEAAFAAKYPDKVLVLDRGTVDGAAYWHEGPEFFFRALGTSLKDELARYEHVLYLESASQEDYPHHVKTNPNRKETWEEAHHLDVLTQALWTQHPKIELIKNQRTFGAKISEVLALIELMIHQ